jgi:predicted RNA-binding Zn ribbon-like protein
MQYLPVMPLTPPDPPFPSGAPYWYWLGGRPALDFVNTRRERWRRNVECLRSPDDLVEWLRATDLLRGEAAATRRTLAAAVELREAIDAGVRAAVRHEAPAAGALEIIDGRLAAAPVRPSLAAGPDGHPLLTERTPLDPLKAALAAIALDAAEMLGRPDERDRIRICGSDTCSARFFDRSPAAARRWCSMAVCGNAAKARRHRARAAAAAPGGDA